MAGGRVAPAGWTTGDLLAYAEGKPLRTMGDLCSVVRSKRPGDQLLVEGIGQFRDNATGRITYDFYSSRIALPR